MLLTDVKKESMVKRIEQVVSVIMEESPIYKEDLDYAEKVQDLLDAFQRNLSFQEFDGMSDDDFKKHCRGIMSIRLLGTIGDEFTPEQMAIFEDAIKRK